ncbi:MAG TPA: DNA polymerase III subunit gamma and tau, partial [Micrococcaceae bacterium]|nr:DNA polymerase III subunit gamma and tau [Micrococcaceae bacterium]
IQTGHDPRRFVEDLLERFRDLIIVQAMPESAHAILRGMPEDQISRMRTQATQLGAAELSRAADVTNSALTEMTGATSPRLHLELLSARLLLPGADKSERGMASRLDRIERRLSYGVAEPAAHTGGFAPDAAPAEGTTAAVPPASRPAPSPVPGSTGSGSRPAAQDVSGRPVPDGRTAEQDGAAAAGEAPDRAQMGRPRVSTNDWPVDEPTAGNVASRPVAGAAARQQAGQPEQGGGSAGEAAQKGRAAQAGAVSAPSGPSGASGTSANGVEVLRRAWPEILENLAKVKRSSWALVAPNATPQSFDGDFLQLAFSTEGLAGAFSRGDHADNLRSAINKTLGISCRVNPVVGGSSAASSSAEPRPKAPADRTGAGTPAPAGGTGSGTPVPAGETGAGTPVPAGPPASGPVPQDQPSAATGQRQAAGPPRHGPVGGASTNPAPEEPPYSDEEPPDDWDAPPPEPSYPSGPARSQRSMGGTAPNAAGNASANHRAPVEPGWGSISDAPSWATAGAAEPASAANPSRPPSTAPSPGTPSDGPSLGTSSSGTPSPGGPSSEAPAPKRMSLYERLKNSPEARAGRASAPERKVDLPYVEDIPSADDETIEESGLVGRAAVERILGGRLIEERAIGGS